MPTFYFHFRNHGALEEDDMGVEFLSLEDAYLGAFEAAREMWTELLRQRTDPMGCAFEIGDKTGRLILTVPFSEVLQTAQAGERRQRLSETKDTSADASHALLLEIADRGARAQRLVSHIATEVQTARDTMASIRTLLDRVSPPAGRSF
jgi:hypothetical protein